MNFDPCNIMHSLPESNLHKKRENLFDLCDYPVYIPSPYFGFKRFARLLSRKKKRVFFSNGLFSIAVTLSAMPEQSIENCHTIFNVGAMLQVMNN